MIEIIHLKIKNDIQKRTLLLKFEKYLNFFELNFLKYQSKVVQKSKTSSPKIF
jgi:hypothetical protein